MALFEQLSSDAKTMGMMQAGLPEPRHVRINRPRTRHHGRTGVVREYRGSEALVAVSACVCVVVPVICLEGIDHE